MTKSKKIIIGVVVAVLVLLLIGGSIACVLLVRKNNKKEPVNYYGIEYNIFEKEISECYFDRTTNYLNMKLDFKISLLNTSGKEFVYNPDVLYLEINEGILAGEDGFLHPATYSNGERTMCFSDLLGADNLITIHENKGVATISASIDLMQYNPYSPTGSDLYGEMKKLIFVIKYNGETIAKFTPNVNVDINNVEGAYPHQ